MSRVKETYNMPKGFEKSFINPRLIVQFILMCVFAGILWWNTNRYLQIPMALFWVALIYYCLKKDYDSKGTRNNLDVTISYYAFKFRTKNDTTLSKQDFGMLKNSLEKKTKREKDE